MAADQVYQLRDGWHCIVSGRVFGPRPDKGSATAGMETEQRRQSEARKKAEIKHR